MTTFNNLRSGPLLDHIYKNFWISSKPTRASLEAYITSLYEKSIKNIVVLMPESEIMQKYNGFDLKQAYRDNGLAVSSFPIQDFDVPSDMKRFRNFVKQISKARKDTIIHCSAGLGRSGLFMACLLVELEMDAASAISLTRRKRYGAIETPEQENFIYDYYQFYQEED